ncbi:hypothetical protein HDU96_001911 [Phlyctochytrium bullatum]|nr:hypothetical protein HDU96_001911 [Phlyctochytrium bullatum]
MTNFFRNERFRHVSVDAVERTLGPVEEGVFCDDGLEVEEVALSSVCGCKHARRDTNDALPANPAGILADEVMAFSGENKYLNLYSVIALNPHGVNLLEYHHIRDIQLFPAEQNKQLKFISNPHEIRKLVTSDSKNSNESGFRIHTAEITDPHRHFASFTLRHAAPVATVVIVNRLASNETWRRRIVGGYVELRRKGLPVWRSPPIKTLQDVYEFTVEPTNQLALPQAFLTSNLSPCVAGAGGAPFFDLFGAHPTEC